MLSRCRVLDLSTERGFLCGQMLGDLGADVIKVEPVGGDPARNLPPYLKDQPGPDHSIYWLAYNRNKRGITLNLETDEGRDILRRLVANSDFLIESENPGAMAARGLGYESVRRINPALVYVSITPFGQDGPKASYADSDLIMMAASGVLVLYGDEDRGPIRMSVPQAYPLTAADAAGAALIAYWERLKSGLGQQVDVAAQESISLAGQSTSLTALVHADETRRMAGGVKMGSIRVPLVWKCKDGLVSCVFLFGTALGVFTRKLVDYIFAQGACSEELKDTDWISYGAKLLSGEESTSAYEQKLGVVAAFFAARTKAQLFEIARENGFLIAPISTIEELLQNAQFKDRDYWRKVEHPDGITLTYPGPFAKLSGHPIAFRRRPPQIGEHNREIFGELGIDGDGIAALARKGVI
ncbi:MAG TPA: CaiB/BaiF CoA-transferase family protein [Candidatus Binataceae bacterium]|nr:CaiB/BaiF CoA-transferase family protein [Candidatus Binataceae bacterium]